MSSRTQAPEPPSASGQAKAAAATGRHPAPGQRRETALSREEIAIAALAQVDERGVAGFSLRDVARAVGVFPTALYWHVPNRAALLSDAVNLALADVLPPPPRAELPWQRWIEKLFTRYRQAVRAHPNVAPLLTGQLSSNAGINLAIADQTLAVLEQAGFSGASLRDAFNMVIGAMVGWVGLEFAPGPGAGEDEMEIKSRLADLDAARYPALARNVALLRNRAFILRWQSGSEMPLDGGFRAFVKTLIDGLEARLAEA